MWYRNVCDTMYRNQRAIATPPCYLKQPSHQSTPALQSGHPDDTALPCHNIPMRTACLPAFRPPHAVLNLVSPAWGSPSTAPPFLHQLSPHTPLTLLRNPAVCPCLRLVVLQGWSLRPAIVTRTEAVCPRFLLSPRLPRPKSSIQAAVQAAAAVATILTRAHAHARIHTPVLL